MEVLRTPDESFESLPDYPFKPHYTQVSDQEGGELRMHHVEVGEPGTETILCLHGEPTWSFLYRKMLPIFSAAGYRVLAPDLIGFGKSDKPKRAEDYTYLRHIAWLSEWIEANELKDITLVCQDWGGLIGLVVAAQQPERFSRIVTANTGLPTGAEPATEVFLEWQNFSQSIDVFSAGQIIKERCVTEVSDNVVAAYDAPYPDETYKAGARHFPMLVPTSLKDPARPAILAAWSVLEKWQLPFQTAFSDSDPMTADWAHIFQERIPGSNGIEHVTIQNGSHFLQEDQGEQFANEVVHFVQRHSVSRQS